MTNPINTQQQYMPQSYPVGSVGAVSINIMNPTVGYPNAMQQPMQNGIYQYPQNNYYAPNAQNGQYPMNYNSNVINNAPAAQNPIQQPPAQDLNATAPVVNNTVNNQPAQNAEKKEGEEKPKQKVVLTDEYIMSLENYLNSQDSKVRLMAAKDILERFKEDPVRKDDVALNALLNKALQDPNSTVRFLALTTLETGYARGDAQTVEILKQIQSNSEAAYGEDSMLASQILLNLSAGDKVDIAPETQTTTGGV